MSGAANDNAGAGQQPAPAGMTALVEGTLGQVAHMLEEVGTLGLPSAVAAARRVRSISVAGVASLPPKQGIGLLYRLVREAEALSAALAAQARRSAS